MPKENLDMNDEIIGSIKDKWGDITYRGGWVALPTILLDQQTKLGLIPEDLVVLSHLIRFWWKKEKLPFPSLSKIGQAMGVEEDYVIERINELEKNKLIKQVPKLGQRTAYDLEGLVMALEKATTRKLNKIKE